MFPKGPKKEKRKRKKEPKIHCPYSTVPFALYSCFSYLLRLCNILLDLTVKKEVIPWSSPAPNWRVTFYLVGFCPPFFSDPNPRVLLSLKFLGFLCLFKLRVFSLSKTLNLHIILKGFQETRSKALSWVFISFFSLFFWPQSYKFGYPFFLFPKPWICIAFCWVFKELGQRLCLWGAFCFMHSSGVFLI